MSKPTLTVYLEHLLRFSEPLIDTAMRLTIESWDKPNMLPPIGVIFRNLERAAEVMRQKQLERHTQSLLREVKSNRPTAAWMQRTILESQAAGNWGPHRIEDARSRLAQLDHGECVDSPSGLNEAIRFDAKMAAANDEGRTV